MQPFIFNWNRQFEKTSSIEDALTPLFDKVIVINSDDNNTKDGWIDIGNESYFSDQFKKALELFDGDILFHIQGDVSYDKWEELIKDAQKYFEYYDPGIYAPNIDYTWYTSENTDIESLESDHQNIKMVACTDETVWFIHKEIIQEMIDRKVDFSKNTMGWGWDLVFAGISFLNGRPVIRDYNHTIMHPRGTDYDKGLASREMIDLWNSLDNELKEVISYIKGDRDQIVKYFKNE